MRTSNLRDVLLIYAFSLVSMAFVGMIVPIASQISARLNASTEAMSLAIALYSAPSAVLATFGGGIVGRIGPKAALIWGASLICAADIAAYFASSLVAFDLTTLLAGLGFTSITIAAPALIIATARDTFRTRALSLWSTYPPAGFSLGLLLAAPFTISDLWPIVPLVHGGILAALLLCSPLLPHPARDVSGPTETGWREIWGVLNDSRLMRLALAISLTCGIGYGTGIIAPSYLAKVHGVSMAASATAVAAAKIAAMLLAGIATGELMSRKLNPFLLFAGASAIGIGMQVVLFWPGSGFTLAAVALGVWLLAYGCLAGIGMALLPSFIRGSQKASSATGVVSQLTSIASFLAPPIYFALKEWQSFVLVVLAGLSLCTLLLPVRGKAITGGKIAGAQA